MQSQISVLVIGGGPAGSTAATLLAQAGFEVTLVEKHRGPRYHIGESLLPSTLEILRLTGAKEKVDAHGFMRKEGGVFDWGSHVWQLHFRERHWKGESHSYQVIRSELDYLLLNHARSEGVNCLEGKEITSILCDDDGRPYQASWVEHDQENKTIRQKGDITFDFLIDASGRNGLMSTRYLKNRRFHEVFRNVAVWGYWQNAIPIDGPRGAIATCAIPNGWIWAIPLHNQTLSVGVVLHKDALQEQLAIRKGDERPQEEILKEIYLQCIEQSQVVSPLLKPATLVSPIKRETDYSYVANQFSGPGFFLVGDAACFLDPLLSTGFHLATFSAMLAAACLISLSKQEVSEEEAMYFHDTAYRQAYLRLLTLVSAFYQRHNGANAYFMEAQKLSQVDYDSSKIIQAFIGIISGEEDLEDIQQRGIDQERLFERLEGLVDTMRTAEADNDIALTEYEQERTNERLREFSSIYTFAPKNAIRGLYLSTEPLGLIRAPIPVALAR